MPESWTSAVEERSSTLGAVVVTILWASIHTLASPMRGGFSTGGLMREGQHPRTEVLPFATLPATHRPQMKSMLGTVSQARMHHNRPMNATDSPSLAAMRSILFQENPPSPCAFARDSALSPMHPHSFCSMFVASTLLFSARERVFSLLSSISDARGIFCGGSKRREGAAPLIAASLFVNPLRFAHHAHTEDLSRLRNEILSFYERDICCKSRIGRFREHRIVSPRH